MITCGNPEVLESVIREAVWVNDAQQVPQHLAYAYFICQMKSVIITNVEVVAVLAIIIFIITTIIYYHTIFLLFDNMY